MISCGLWYLTLWWKMIWKWDKKWNVFPTVSIVVRQVWYKWYLYFSLCTINDFHFYFFILIFFITIILSIKSSKNSFLLFHIFSWNLVFISLLLVTSRFRVYLFFFNDFFILLASLFIMKIKKIREIVLVAKDSSNWYSIFFFFFKIK